MRRFTVIAFAGTILAVLISPNGPLGGFWAPAPDLPAAAGAVRVGFIAEAMVENLAFGVGIAILLTGRHWFGPTTRSAFRTRTAWLATVWLFASWMPHAALHRHIGMQPAGLLPIEWIFHGGAIAALTALLWALSIGPRHPLATPAAGHQTHQSI